MADGLQFGVCAGTELAYDWAMKEESPVRRFFDSPWLLATIAAIVIAGGVIIAFYLKSQSPGAGP